MVIKDAQYKDILTFSKEIKSLGKKIVFCDGHFNIIHPGHMRFLNYCKKLGDVLIVGVHGQEHLPIETRDKYFTEDERNLGVSSLNLVDKVVGLKDSIASFISKLEPDFYVKGSEFEQMQDKIKSEIDAVLSYGGKVLFNSGDVVYTNQRLAQITSSNPQDNEFLFLSKLKKYEVTIEDISQSVKKIKEKSILVIGDTIVDQFVVCDTLGVSAEAPVLAIRELESKEFMGGAAIVAMHAKSLGARVEFLSVVGNDQNSEFVKSQLQKSKIILHLIEDISRPTIFKIRYMVGNQKILRVSKLKEHQISQNIENKILKKLDEISADIDGIIVCDFVYGLITPKIIEKIVEIKRQKNIKIFGDLQCSSQIGDVSKFKNFTTITPTEKEARVALNDKTSGLEKLARELLKSTECENVVITLGSQGSLVFSQSSEIGQTNHSEHLNALIVQNPVDVAGAGDAFLVGYALGTLTDLNPVGSAALGTAMASIVVNRIGNVPVAQHELNDKLKSLQAFEKLSKIENNNYHWVKDEFC